MATNFFNWFETENVEIFEGDSLQKPVKAKGNFLTNSYPTVLKAAALTAALSFSSPAMSQESVKQDENANNKTEQEKTQAQQKDDEKTINFFDAANVKKIEENGKTYYLIDGKTLITPEMLNKRQRNRDYKKSEKELRKNAEGDRIHQDTILASEAKYAGLYSRDDKSVNLPFFINDLKEAVEKHPHLIDELKTKGVSVEKESRNFEKYNDQNSMEHKSIKAHEYQHKTNDAFGIYAPGLSTEQYAILNQYDEISANVAGLNVYISNYEKELKSGKTKDEALEVFGDCDHFKFYKDAIKNGLDPKSDEGKAKMISGCMDLWKNNLSKSETYKSQMYATGENSIKSNSFQDLILGNEKELQKRVDKIFSNILVDGKPTDMSKYLPNDKPELSQELKDNLSYRVRDETGLDAGDITTINQQVEGKSYKQKEKTVIESLRGTSKPKTNNSNLQELNKDKSKTAAETLKTRRDNSGR